MAEIDAPVVQLQGAIRDLRNSPGIVEFIDLELAITRFRSTIQDLLIEHFNEDMRLTGRQLNDLIAGTCFAVYTSMHEMQNISERLRALEDQLDDRMDQGDEDDALIREEIRNINERIMENEASIISGGIMLPRDGQHRDQQLHHESSMKLLSEAVKYLPSNKNPPS